MVARLVEHLKLIPRQVNDRRRVPPRVDPVSGVGEKFLKAGSVYIGGLYRECIYGCKRGVLGVMYVYVWVI